MCVCVDEVCANEAVSIFGVLESKPGLADAQ